MITKEILLTKNRIKTMTKQTYIEPAVDARDINCESGIATSGILQDWDENKVYQETF